MASDDATEFAHERLDEGVFYGRFTLKDGTVIAADDPRFMPYFRVCEAKVRTAPKKHKNLPVPSDFKPETVNKRETR